MDLTLDWQLVTDGVMGGVSRGTLTRITLNERAATALRGTVSLDNNGGFIQMAADLGGAHGQLDARGWDGLALELWGNGAAYDIRLRTDQLDRPWQSFRTEVQTDGAWHVHRLPFDAFTPHRTDAVLDVSRLRRLGILAIGREFEAEIAVADVRLYRDSA